MNRSLSVCFRRTKSYRSFDLVIFLEQIYMGGSCSEDAKGAKL